MRSYRYNMKYRISKLIFLFGIVLSTVSFAQTMPTLPSKSDELLPAPKTKDVHYCCIKCNYCTTLPGNCPVDKSPLVKEGSYFCKTCLTVSDKPGRCPKCNRSMKKMQIPTKQALVE